MPIRFQLRRTKGWRMPEGGVKVDRTTPFGNQFVIVALDDGRFGITRFPNAHDREDDMTFADSMEEAREEAAGRYRAWLVSPGGQFMRRRLQQELRGRDIGCWCSLESACHGNVILEVANLSA